MFEVSTVFEDSRINAWSETGHTYQFNTKDNLTGEVSPTIELSALELSYVLQFNLHPDGTPEGYEKMYEVLEPKFADWSNNVRPIP